MISTINGDTLALNRAAQFGRYRVLYEIHEADQQVAVARLGRVE